MGHSPAVLFYCPTVAPTHCETDMPSYFTIMLDLSTGNLETETFIGPYEADIIDGLRLNRPHVTVIKTVTLDDMDRRKFQATFPKGWRENRWLLVPPHERPADWNVVVVPGQSDIKFAPLPKQPAKAAAPVAPAGDVGKGEVATHEVPRKVVCKPHKVRITRKRNYTSFPVESAAKVVRHTTTNNHPYRPVHGLDTAPAANTTDMATLLATAIARLFPSNA